MGEVVRACTSLTLHPPSPPTVHSRLAGHMISEEIITWAWCHLTCHTHFPALISHWVSNPLVSASYFIIYYINFTLIRTVLWL